MNSSNSVLGFWKAQTGKWWLGIYIGLYIRWRTLADQRGVEYNTVAEQEVEAFTDWFVEAVVDAAMALPPTVGLAVSVLGLVAITYPKLRRLGRFAEASVRRNGLLTTVAYGIVFAGLVGGYMVLRADPPAELEPFLTRGIHQ
jgi:hypothetical protein